MQILVTGADGYIGSYLTKLLLDKGHYVTTLDSGFAAKCPFDFTGYTRQLRRFRASISNVDAVHRAMDGVEVVYHLAARMDYNSSFRHPIRLVDTNVRGTVNLLSVANKAGVDRIVYTSSAAVYGNIVGACETDTPNPIEMYGATKAAAEAIIRAFYHKGMETIILRLYNVWGGLGSNSVIDKFVRGHNIVIGDGSQTRDFVHIKDTVKALYASMNWDSSIYNIGTGEEITIKGIWAKLNKLKEPDYQEPERLEIIRSCADVTYISNYWKPEVFVSELTGDEIRNYCGVRN
jgi:UDP-glucose 4-epimerase